MTPMADEADTPKYIPITRHAVRERLGREPGFSEVEREGLSRIADMLEAIWHHRVHSLQERLKRTYEAIDPDQIETGSQGMDAFLDSFEEALLEGNWEAITDEEIEHSIDATDVFPINLHVRFDEFDRMRMFKLGEERTTETRRKGLRKTEAEIVSYGRVVQAIQFKDKAYFEEKKRLKDWPGEHATGLHLRLFKRVPKADLETLFPNTSPNMRALDKIKIIAPLVGGLVTLALKFGPLIAFLLFGIGQRSQGRLDVAVVGGLMAGLVTYAAKSYLAYRKTKERYLGQVSRDLYFKAQATNATVINAIIDLMEEQEVKEALCAYAFARLAREPISIAALDDRIEGWFAEQGVIVNFEVVDALEKLQRFGILVANGKRYEGPLEPTTELEVVGPSDAARLLDEYWDQIFNRPPASRQPAS
jgi:hypothetical protein